MKQNKTLKMVMIAVMMALHFILSRYFSISIGKNFALSFAGLPVIMCGFMYGPAAGFISGFFGSFLSQILGPYGFTVTTVLWAMPAGVLGIITGAYASREKYVLKRTSMLIMILISNLIVTLLNTGVMVIDGTIFHYLNWASLLVAVPFRIISGVLRAVIYAAIIYPVISRIPAMRDFVIIAPSKRNNPAA